VKGKTNQLKENKKMKPTTNIIYPAFALFAFACCALAPQARAVCQDACLANQNTVQGDDALFSLTTGFGDTAIGFQALYSNTSGHGNNAVGDQALYSNIDGIDNTAIGYFTLLNNLSGSGNTAISDYGLYSNTTGSNNTASGLAALYSNTTGDANTASGVEALYSNTTGRGNTAIGRFALQINTTGDFNTATGNFALSSNSTGSENLAYGSGALFSNTTGYANAGYGGDALFGNTTGSFNVAVGFEAGSGLTTGDNNINIGPYVSGGAGESNTIRIGTQGTQTNAYIGGIYSTPVAKGLVVKVDSTGHLGTVGSSGRFKEQIKPMGKASEAILGLKPVTFRYKKEIDPERTPEFGLVAEDVEKVNPDLVARDEQGKPYTVRYDAVNAMLLNEFLKEHRKVEDQAATIAQMKKEIERLSTGLQKVGAEIETSKSAQRVVSDN